MRTISKIQTGQKIHIEYDIKDMSSTLGLKPMKTVQPDEPVYLEYDLSGGPSSFVNEPTGPVLGSTIISDKHNGKVERIPDLQCLGVIPAVVSGEEFDLLKSFEDRLVREARDVTPDREGSSIFQPMPFFTKRPPDLTEEQKFIQIMEFVDAWHDPVQNQYWKVDVIRRLHSPNQYVFNRLPKAKYKDSRVMNAVEAMAFVEGFEKLVGPDVLKGFEL